MAGTAERLSGKGWEMIVINANELCTFKELEDYLREKDTRIYIKVRHQESGNLAIMLMFYENFCGDWRSGDGVLFYQDNETHSAESEDLFKVLSIHDIFEP